MTSYEEGKFKNVNESKEQFSLIDVKFVGKDASTPPLPTRSTIREAAPQFFASMGFGFMVASVAAICMIPTIVIDALRHPDSEIPLDKTQQSWYGSLSFLVQPIGAITSGFTQDIFGRRRMMMASTVPLFASWIFLHFADGVAALYITQIVFGLSIGCMEAPSMSFLGEAMQPKYRGTLTALSEFLYIVGSFYLFTCGVYFDWRTVALCGALPPLITFGIMCALPESPTWFIVKGRLDDADKAMMWLRGWVTQEEVQQEIKMLTKAITENPFSGAKIIDGEYTRVKNTPSQVVLFKERRVWKPVLLVFIFFFAGNAGSLIGMRPFFSKMFEDLNMPIAPGLVLVMSSALNAVGCIVCTCIVHKMGKRVISIGSLLVLAACCFLLAAYTASKAAFPWLATLLFAVNFFTAGFGILTMPWALVSECFSLEARGLSAGMCAASAYVSYFLFSKTYYTFEDWITMPGVFAMYGVISVLGASYLHKFMPETEGKTLGEIEEFFQK